MRLGETKHRSTIVRLGGAALLIAVMSMGLTAGRSSEQTQVASLVNQTRVQYGRSVLNDNQQLDVKAQAWAEHLARLNSLPHSHLPDGISYNWRALGENVGYGGSIAQLHTAYMNSPVGFFTSSVLGRMWPARWLQLPHLVFMRCKK